MGVGFVAAVYFADVGFVRGVNVRVFLAVRRVGEPGNREKDGLRFFFFKYYN